LPTTAIDTKVDIAHRLESKRSMCDDACCDFLAIDTKQISHIDWNRIGRCAMMHVVIFLAKRYKTDIVHRLANRIGRCAMMHVVIFLANRYKSRYRTSTDESNRSMCDDACCDFSGQEIQNRYRASTDESVDVR